MHESIQPCTCGFGPAGRETYNYLKGRYVYDVARAREIVGDGRATLEIAAESVRLCVDESVINEVHVAHVDPSAAGIVAIFRCTTEDGEDLRTHVLIDGNHRAARCLQLGLPFRAYFLSDEESEQILLRKHEGPLRRADLL